MWGPEGVNQSPFRVTKNAWSNYFDIASISLAKYDHIDGTNLKGLCIFKTNGQIADINELGFYVAPF